MVRPSHAFTLPHRVGHVTVSPCERHLVAFSPEESTVSIFSAASVCEQVDLGQPTGSLCLAIDPTGTFLAFAHEGDDRLQVWNLRANERVPVSHASEVVDARFDALGRLWTVRRGIESYVVELRSAGDWQKISEIEAGDAYFLEGGAQLGGGQSENSLLLSVYSGQSEQQNFLCQVQEGRMTARHLASMDGEQFMFASQDSAAVVVLDHVDCAALCFRNPQEAPLARIPWPDYEEGECEDERPGYFGCHIGGNRFLAGSSEGRLFLAGLSPFRFLKEIEIAGHAPVPASVKYPTLSDACGRVSNLAMFGRRGDVVIAFFAESPQTRPQVTIIPIAEILGSA